MRFAQGRLLRLVAPWLAPVLIGPEKLEAIARFADDLPDAFTWGILELRLIAGDPRADLEVCAASLDGSRAAIAEALADPASAERARGSLGSLEPLLRAWAAGDGRLAEMPQVFLEYDDPASGRRAPFAFLATDHDPRARPAPPALGTDDAIAIARDGLERTPGGLDPEPFATWERCVRALPPGGKPLTMAPLAGRGVRAVRLDALLPRTELGGWLDAIGWPGDRRRLAELLGWLGPHWQRYRLQLDLGQTVGPNLGVLYRPPTAPRDPESWRPLIDLLCALGVCAPDKADAALGWPGMQGFDLPDLAWPIVVQRDLDFKLTLTPGGLEAKSYASYHAAWSVLGARCEPLEPARYATRGA